MAIQRAWLTKILLMAKIYKGKFQHQWPVGAHNQENKPT